MSVEDKILSLVKLADPANPIDFTKDIVKEYALDKINDCIKDCKKCDICSHKIKTVGYGNVSSPILVVGDSVSQLQYENREMISLPMHDKDGETFQRALGLMNIDIKDLYAINIINCFPCRDNNGAITKRLPSSAERTACRDFVDRVIEALHPAIIITLGSVASNAFSQNKIAITKDRGQVFDYKGYKVMPTFHPAHFREMANIVGEEMINMNKEEFLYDIYNAFLIAKEDTSSPMLDKLISPYE